MTDLASASRAIEVIVEQGEGARGDWVNSHFGKFVGILEDFLTVRAADPAFEPARPVIPAFLRWPPDVDVGNSDRGPADPPRGRRCSTRLYEVILQVQAGYFVHHGETPDELETLAKTAKHLMNWVMRQPRPDDDHPSGRRRSFPGKTAGPAFEIVRPAFFVLPHREAAWKILRERFIQLGTVADELSREGGLAALSDIARTLNGFAGDLDGHIQARARAS